MGRIGRLPAGIELHPEPDVAEQRAGQPSGRPRRGESRFVRRAAGFLSATALCVLLLGCRPSESSTGPRWGSGAASEETTLGSIGGNDAGRIVYFFSPGCPECDEVGTHVLPVLERALGRADRVNVETTEGLERVLTVERRFGARLETLAPILLVDDRLWVGLDNIRRSMETVATWKRAGRKGDTDQPEAITIAPEGQHEAPRAAPGEELPMVASE